MSKPNPRIKDYMSDQVQTIGEHQPMSVAHRLMRSQNIHQLPVLQKDRLVGIVTDGDLRLIETLPDFDPTKVTVGQAMSANVYVAEPEARLSEVVTYLGSTHSTAAVVVDRGRVVGIFTPADACRALAELLSGHSRVNAT